jgi:hypothetical protein
MFAPCLLERTDPAIRGLSKTGRRAPDPGSHAPGPRRHARPTPIQAHQTNGLDLRGLRRHSCGDTPLMPQARHAGYIPGMREAAARRSRAMVPAAVSLEAASPLGTSVCRRRPEHQVLPPSLSGDLAAALREHGSATVDDDDEHYWHSRQALPMPGLRWRPHADRSSRNAA